LPTEQQLLNIGVSLEYEFQLLETFREKIKRGHAIKKCETYRIELAIKRIKRWR